MFKLESKNALLQNINLRPEQHGDEYEPALDVKFTCECGSDMAYFLLGGEKGGKPLDFWVGKYKDIRFHGLSGGIGSKAEFDDCDVKFKNVTMKNVKVNKFTFQPQNGGKVLVTLRVQLNPTDAQLTKLSHYQRKGGKLTIKTDSVFDPLEESGGEQTEIPMDE